APAVTLPPRAAPKTNTARDKLKLSPSPSLLTEAAAVVPPPVPLAPAWSFPSSLAAGGAGDCFGAASDDVDRRAGHCGDGGGNGD
ncbi:unnamed protein product, partial [Ectocarpus sp. 12 AP-2014]